MNPLGKILIFTGVAIILIGVALLFFDKIPLLGKLPGDFVVRRKNFAAYFPIATSIAISLILTFVIFIINYFRK